LYKLLIITLELASLLEILNFFFQPETSVLLTDYLFNTEINTGTIYHKAIAPMAIMAGSSLLQTGLGAYQSFKAGKQKVDDSQEKEAMANMVANQKKLISRAKNREAMGGEMPGMSRAEEALGSKTAQFAERYREMGNQAGYQDYLNQALQMEQQKLADLGVKSAQFQLERSKDVDNAIAGMNNIYARQFGRGAQSTDQQRANIENQRRTAAGNIAGGIQGAATAGMFMANGQSEREYNKDLRRAKRAERRAARQDPFDSFLD